VVPFAALVRLSTGVLWIGLDKMLSYPHMSARVGFDPFASIADAGQRNIFLACAFLGWF